MEDHEIVNLFFERSEAAIKQCEEKYNNYLLKVAYNILGNTEDCMECINDSLLKVWNKIPPAKPNNLKLFISKFVRQSAIDIVRKQSSQKRFSGEYELSLEELNECITENSSQNHIEAEEFGKKINDFLKNISKEKRDIFVLRYYYFFSIEEISLKRKISSSKVKTTLHRVRKELKEFLIKEGYSI